MPNNCLIHLHVRDANTSTLRRNTTGYWSVPLTRIPGKFLFNEVWLRNELNSQFSDPLRIERGKEEDDSCTCCVVRTLSSDHPGAKQGFISDCLLGARTVLSHWLMLASSSAASTNPLLKRTLDLYEVGAPRTLALCLNNLQ
ncbi:hypothetical protein BDZ91DRAFT_762629 [Kalaharituber pfeilii]|nr:hypothetical protein BDZ91DRAFT_762629 [Kalaharituber pfeilii]